MAEPLNRALWLATANNPSLSMELTRRTVPVRLDPMVSEPWLREEFRHPKLATWARKNRADLVRSLLVLGRTWVVAGSPQGSRTLGSFESWAGVLGGILEVAGIPGFLGNLKQHYEGADAEGEAWRELCAAWWEAFQDKPVRPSELGDLCRKHNLIPAVRGAGTTRSQDTNLGMALLHQRSRVFDRFRVCLAKDQGTKHGRHYALQLMESTPSTVIDDGSSDTVSGEVA
jgi:hypothetical protein